MSIIKLCGIALISLFVCIVLKVFRSDITGLISSAFIVCATCIAMAIFAPIAEYAGDLMTASGVADYFTPVMKAFGIGMIAGTTSDICTDNGHAAMASGIETAAKIAIVALSLPTVRTIIAAAISMVE